MKATTWDGKGINDDEDPYKRRMFTARTPDDVDDWKMLNDAGRLAAAAPELLAALQSALKTAEVERAPFRPWQDAARAAIARGIGDQR